MKNCIVVTGGGTAGHIMPIVAILPELKKHFKNIVYIGSHKGMEKEIIKDYPYVNFCEIDTIKFDRVHLFKNFAIPFVLIKSIIQCKHILKMYKVDCIFSKGGYVALPVVLASYKIPVISHESDMSLGLANKIIYHKAKVMCTGFEMPKQKRKYIYTGVPIKLRNQSKNNLNFNLDKKKKTLLIMGGSLGSNQINQTFELICDKVCEKVNVIHIVGRGNIIEKVMPKNYNQIEFTNQMDAIYQISDFALSRAGATSINELLFYNIPMLLIPLSGKVSRGDQEQNAKIFEQKGYARVLSSEELTAYNLLNALHLLIKNASTIKSRQRVEKLNSVELVMQQILKFSK